MALKIFNRRISDSSTTGGTGSQTLLGPSGGATSGENLGAVASDGDQVVLCLTDLAGNFEVSQCTVSISQAGVVSISRDTVIASSADSLAKANFNSGNVKITNFVPSTLELVLFNVQYQQAAAASLSAMASGISDIESALEAILS